MFENVVIASMHKEEVLCYFQYFFSLSDGTVTNVVFLCLTLQFDTDYVEFCSQFDNLRQQMQNFVDSWFDKDLTVSSNWKKKKDS